MSLNDKIARTVKAEQVEQVKPKRMTVAVQPDDYQLLSAKAQELGISKTRYLALLVAEGLKS